MHKNARKMYHRLQIIAKKNQITFRLYLGRHMDAGELCMDYNNLEEYLLFAYDRDNKTYNKAFKDADEFEYTVFEHLCNNMGFEYELKHRDAKVDRLRRDDDDLESDTRKVAFEHSLFLLNSIKSEWLFRASPEYERLLNLWRKVKNVIFDKNSMIFIEYMTK